MRSTFGLILRAIQRRRAAVVLGCATVAFSAGVATLIGQDGGEINQPVDFSHNVVDAPAPVAGAVFGSGPALHPGDRICTTATQNTANVNTDCENLGPSNETSIAVNPKNPNNMIGGANDYQLALNPGGHVSESVLSRAHVTFDGGKTWSDTRSCSTRPIKRPVIRLSRSTRMVMRTTRLSGSGSSVRRTR